MVCVSHQPPRGEELRRVALLSALAFLAGMAPIVPRARSEPATPHSVLAGVRYVWRNQIVLGAISLDLFAVLLGGATALLPIYARDILHLGPWALGALRSAPAVGATARRSRCRSTNSGAPSSSTCLAPSWVAGSAAILLSFQVVVGNAGGLPGDLRSSVKGCGNRVEKG
jgi:hypothetical protein